MGIPVDDNHLLGTESAGQGVVRFMARLDWDSSDALGNERVETTSSVPSPLFALRLQCEEKSVCKAHMLVERGAIEPRINKIHLVCPIPLAVPAEHYKPLRRHENLYHQRLTIPSR